MDTHNFAALILAWKHKGREEEGVEWGGGREGVDRGSLGVQKLFNVLVLSTPYHQYSLSLSSFALYLIHSPLLPNYQTLSLFL